MTSTQHAVGHRRVGRRARRREDLGARLVQHRDHRRADPLGAAGHERTAAGEPQIEAHGVTRSNAILSPSRPNA